MTKVMIEVNIDNDAFHPFAGVELADLLRILSDRVEGAEDAEDLHGLSTRITDTYGNTVGRWYVVA